MNKKKILFIVNVDWFFVSHRLPIAIAAIKSGYDVSIACANTGKFEYLSELGIKCYDIPFTRSGMNPIKELASLYKLAKAIKHVSPDLVHTVTIKPALYSGILLHFIKVHSKVFAISGLGLVFSSSGMKIKRFLVANLYRVAFKHKQKKIIFQNPVDRSTMMTVLKEDGSDAEMIRGSGVDLNDFLFVEEDNSEIRVVMAARLLKDKGVYDFVEAAKILSVKKPDIKFVLIGAIDPDNPTSVTVDEFTEWMNSDYIEVLGARSDISKQFLLSNIVVLPSYYGEGLPKVIIEAAASGRAVITTDNPGCLEAVEPGISAIIVPSKQPATLAKTISELAHDNVKRNEMGRAGRELAVREFNINSVVNKHLSIYHRLIND
jgi:glycosyltransferase involved in cell wall biosynthesis